MWLITGDIILLVVYVLILLFVISFALFIRRLSINSATRNRQTSQIDAKLDRIIELLEKDNNA
ncbi:DUF4083 domain-containing protein [Gracilibacillus halotolerans]|uniref:DUF4083 domain-containing protein n=1 Tax=Gracilibacillus halotolerans TaxID=74386 RepID=UPI00161E61A7|nr:DUF4083 domain-containing protein [Gracilibacillus halotolerans]